MPLNLAAAALNAFLDRGEHRLGQAFATLPDAARGWLHDSLPRAQALLAADGRVATWQTALAALPDLTVTQRHLGATVRALNASIAGAQASLAELREAANEADRVLGEKVSAARLLADELSVLSASGERIANRIEGSREPDRRAVRSSSSAGEAMRAVR